MKTTILLLVLHIVLFASCSESLQEDTNLVLIEDSILINEETLYSPIYKDTSLTVTTYQEAYSKYIELGLSHDSMGIKKEAPRYFIQNIALSNRKLTTNQRKELFISIILTNTLLVNEKMMITRNKMEEVLAQDIFNNSDSTFLDSLCHITHIKNSDYSQLSIKYDIMPPSLVISQAIVESAWGTSHFAVEGNSLFGEHMSHSAKGKYIQASGSSIRLRAFDTIEEAIAEYIANLNRNGAYKGVREARHHFRTTNTTFNGLQLAEKEGHYSEMGSSYIKTIKGVITHNKLHAFDDVVLNEMDSYFIHIQK